MAKYSSDYCPCVQRSSPGCDPKTFCWSCYKHETIPESGAYRVCFECGHVYLTAADLEAAYAKACEAIEAQDNRVGFGTGPVRRSAADIYFCQECIHDF